jgi:hypothetical protein
MAFWLRAYVLDSYSQVFTFTRRSRRVKGRNLSVTQLLSRNTNPVSNITDNTNIYLYPVFSSLVFQQLRATNTPSANGFLFVNYSTPLSSRLVLRLNPYLTYQKNEQNIVTYGRHFGKTDYDSLNTSLSTNLAREMTRWAATGVLSYTIKRVTINMGGGWLQQWINNSFTMGTQNSRTSLLGSFVEHERELEKIFHRFFAGCECTRDQLPAARAG